MMMGILLLLLTNHNAYYLAIMLDARILIIVRFIEELLTFPPNLEQ